MYGLISSILIAVSGSPTRALAAGLIEVSMLSLFTFALLQLFGKSLRWPQTVTALAGSGSVLSVFAIPVYLILGLNAAGAATNDPFQGLALLALLSLALWSIAIMAYILRHALETNLFFTFSFAFAYIWLILNVSSILIPAEVS